MATHLALDPALLYRAVEVSAERTKKSGRLRCGATHQLTSLKFTS